MPMATGGSAGRSRGSKPMAELPALDGEFTRLAIMLGEIETQRNRVHAAVRNMRYEAGRVSTAKILPVGYDNKALSEIGQKAVREVMAEAAARMETLAWLGIELEVRKLASLCASYRRAMCGIAAKAAVQLADFENVPAMMEALRAN